MQLEYNQTLNLDLYSEIIFLKLRGRMNTLCLRGLELPSCFVSSSMMHRRTSVDMHRDALSVSA